MALLYWKQVSWLFSLSKDNEDFLEDTSCLSWNFGGQRSEQVRLSCQKKKRYTVIHTTCKTSTKCKSKSFLLGSCLSFFCEEMIKHSKIWLQLRVICLMVVHLMVNHPGKVMSYACLCVKSVQNGRCEAFKFSRCSNWGASVFLTLKIKMTDQREPVQPDSPFQDQTSCLVTDTGCTPEIQKTGSPASWWSLAQLWRKNVRP